MLWLCTVALAAEIVVDAKVPVSLRVDGSTVAELRLPGQLRVEVPAGDHKVVLVTQTEEHPFSVTARDDAPVVLLAGRSGVSVGFDAQPAPLPVDGTPEVRFVVVGPVSLMVYVGRQRLLIDPGPGRDLVLPLGTHEVSVRSVDGAEVYARGTLTVSGTGELLVQVSEGRLPETSGSGLSFAPSGR